MTESILILPLTRTFHVFCG